MSQEINFLFGDFVVPRFYNFKCFQIACTEIHHPKCKIVRHQEKQKKNKVIISVK